MTRKVQRGVSLFPSMWEKVYEIYPKLNMKTHSDYLEMLVANDLKSRGSMLSEPISDKTEKEIELGKIADRRKSKKFSLIRSVKDLIEDEEGSKELLEKGFLSQEQ